MNKIQLDAAMKLAQDVNVRFIDDRGNHLEDTSIFDGFALPDFKPVTCTVRQVAALIRWQCVMTNGSIDGENLQEIVNIGRHKFNVIGEGSGVALAKPLHKIAYMPFFR